MLDNTPIIAVSTPAGRGAIALIRVSGDCAVEITSGIFRPTTGANGLIDAKGYTVHHGTLYSGEDIIDDVLVTVFRAPKSYTGQEMTEITCHGSTYIQQRILEEFAKNGCRIAKPGEFTMRAFLNGKMDLSQAEAVADLIASNSTASHQLALMQMRGGFSKKISELRQKLLDFASLIELEMDFGEEDVEFANRQQLMNFLEELRDELSRLIASFRLGNVIKHGIPVAIAGKPNVGKSTLLNALLNEERAIVSEIPGTTRDTIEDSISIDGVVFRFIDTAGLRDANDSIELAGIARTKEKIEHAAVILYVFDINEITVEELNCSVAEILSIYKKPAKQVILVANKTDLLVQSPHDFVALLEHEIVFISAKRKENIHLIAERLLRSVDTENITDNTIISNARHLEALQGTLHSVNDIVKGFSEALSTDLITTDLRQALYYLGSITGHISSDELLDNIFKRFCIGK